MNAPHGQHRGSAPPPHGDAFADRVMARVGPELPPTPTRAFVSAVRERSLPDASSALWVAWHLGTVRSWRISPRVRVRSIALVLSVICALGIGSIAAGAAVRVVATGINELGEVENNPPFGTDEQGETTNDGSTTPDGVDGADADQPAEEPNGADADQPAEAPSTGAETDQPADESGGTDSDQPDGTDQSGTEEPASSVTDRAGSAGAAQNEHDQSGTDETARARNAHNGPSEG